MNSTWEAWVGLQYGTTSKFKISALKRHNQQNERQPENREKTSVNSCSRALRIHIQNSVDGRMASTSAFQEHFKNFNSVKELNSHFFLKTGSKCTRISTFISKHYRKCKSETTRVIIRMTTATRQKITSGKVGRIENDVAKIKMPTPQKV